MLFQHVLPILTLFSILAAAPSCQTTHGELEPIALTANPGEEVAKLRSKIAEAKLNNVDILSPSWFEEADSHYQIAESVYLRGGEVGEIFEQLSHGNLAIEKAMAYQTKARRLYPKVLDARQRALKAGASQYPTSREHLEEANKQMLLLGEALEEDNLEWVDGNKKNATNLYREAELEAIRLSYLSEVYRENQLAESAGADRYAPKSFEETQNYISDTESFIRVDPYHRSAIEKRKEHALFLVRRLTQLTNEIKKIKYSNSENLALWYEKKIQDLSKALQLGDQRNLDFDSQFLAAEKKASTQSKTAMTKKETPKVTRSYKVTH